MKKYIPVPIALLIAVLFLNFNQIDNKISDENPPLPGFTIPDDVQQVIDNSCYGCHNSDSKNIKGKGKLKFDRLPDLKTHKLVGKLSNIADVLKNDDMPPKKFLKNFPDSKLTAEQKELFVNWAESTATSLSE